MNFTFTFTFTFTFRSTIEHVQLLCLDRYVLPQPQLLPHKEQGLY